MIENLAPPQHTSEAVCAVHEAGDPVNPSCSFSKGDRVLVEWNGLCYWAEAPRPHEAPSALDPNSNFNPNANAKPNPNPNP